MKPDANATADEKNVSLRYGSRQMTLYQRS
jgi:hypothetical protein